MGATLIPQNTAWWTRFDYFNQGVATLGGGDLTLTAGGNVTDISASTATNAYMPGSAPLAAALVEQGGGDLSVRAGNDIRGGVYYVQKGLGTLHADGAITTGSHTVTFPGSPTVDTLGTILAMGDARVMATAGGNLRIEGAFNPTLVTQNLINLGLTSVPNTLAPGSTPNQFGSFSTYGADSAVALTSVTGNVALIENANDLFLSGGGQVGTLNAAPAVKNSLFDLGMVVQNSFVSLYRVQPPSLIATAMSGDVSFHDGFSLWPSTTGQLKLLARGSVLAVNQHDADGNLIGFSQPITMLDRAPASMPTAAHPYFPDASLLTIMQGLYAGAGVAAHTPGGLHLADTNPAQIVALNGDVNFGSYLGSSLILPKSLDMLAGRDILNAGFVVQQLAPTDVTTIQAGRDILDATAVGGNNFIEHIVQGPGRIDFVAGRNFDLGNGMGVVTRGSLDNPYLPATGAGISVVAGARSDYSGFAQTYVTALGELAPNEQALLVADMRQLQPTLPHDLTPSAAWTAYTGLSEQTRNTVLNDLFFARLARVAGAIGGGKLDLTAFDTLIASLFPTTNISGGDINVFGSQLKTERGGAISLFTPGGSVYAGLASVPAYLKSKSASDLGIFTIGGGALQALVKTDFSVNQGRVFTLGGGDITLASQWGNIDAGRGAKTAAATPPPVLTTDKDGNTQVDISASISGSGIATLQSGPNVSPSNVYAIAPRGIFDAGDAGVRSTGTVSLVAATVLNANNIAASGGVSGAPAVSTSGLSGAVSAPASAATAATDSVAKSAAGHDTQANMAAMLSVELLGYGDADHQPVTSDDQTPEANDGPDADKRDKKKPI